MSGKKTQPFLVYEKFLVGEKMFFEGSEKKVEIVLREDQKSLLNFELDYWKKLVNYSGATILSEESTPVLKAFLLSESSLFVWKNRITMITCGRTTLVDAILFFISEYEEEQIDSIIFQRKNEYAEHLQATIFLKDIERLRQKVDGQAMRFGKMDEHHNYLFHLNKKFFPHQDDVTTEVLMYHVRGSLAELLQSPKQKIENVQSGLGIKDFFSDFKFDDFLFKPVGYSLNGIKDDQYLTVHITPQEGNSYVSFETNVNIATDYPDFLTYWLGKFRPESFDLITFNTNGKINLPDNYIQLSNVENKLSCGYDVTFNHYFEQRKETEQPYTL